MGNNPGKRAGQKRTGKTESSITNDDTSIYRSILTDKLQVIAGIMLMDLYVKKRRYEYIMRKKSIFNTKKRRRIIEDIITSEKGLQTNRYRKLN